MENGTIEFTGSLAPGDVLIIDTDARKILKNGLNAVDLVDGVFFMIEQGYDELSYSDSEESRSVNISVTYTPKYK